MKYGNLLPPEGINTTQAHPLKEFVLLTSGLIGIIGIAIIIIGLMVEHLADQIPFETEVAMSQTMAAKMEGGSGEVQSYLQQLADSLAAAQNLPDDMSITVHYVNNPTVNAMASLGGHVVMFQGLLQKLESENAIAMVLAHEIAHVQHRHPIKSLGRGAMISLALAAIGITAGDAGNLLGSAGLLTALSFSRSQEEESDYTSLRSLFHHYGHVNGGTDLFEVLLKEEAGFMPQVTFLRTHPLSKERIQNILDYARQKDWPIKGELTSIPEHLRAEIAASPKPETASNAPS